VFTVYMCVSDQCAKMRDHIAKVRDVLINRDEQTPESIRGATSELQQASLKLFEMAYKKVCHLYTRGHSVTRHSVFSTVSLRMSSGNISRNFPALHIATVTDFSKFSFTFRSI